MKREHEQNSTQKSPSRTIRGTDTASGLPVNINRSGAKNRLAKKNHGGRSMRAVFTAFASTPNTERPIHNKSIPEIANANRIFLISGLEFSIVHSSKCEDVCERPQPSPQSLALQRGLHTAMPFP